MADRAHEQWCKLYADDDWNSATLQNYIASYGEAPACTCRPAFVMEIPVQTVSEMNMREHWSQKYKRKKAQQTIVTLLLRNRPAELYPARVRLTRLAARRLDADNLASSQKHVQDAVARWLGVDDGDAAVTWEYAQEKRKGYAVR